MIGTKADKMCSPSTPRDNSAEIARAEEAARQERIATGQASIDQSFAGFNDDFYNQYQQDYTDYYNPQLDDQFADANKRLTLQLAQSGNLTGSVGARQLADLRKNYDDQKLAIAGNASNAVQGLRSDIDNNRSQLYANNRAAADPGSAASAATSAAQSLQPGPQTSPLGNVFSDFFSNVGNVQAVRQNTSNSQGGGVQSFGGRNGGSVTTIGD